MAALKKKTAPKAASNSLADIPSGAGGSTAPISGTGYFPPNPGGMYFPSPADFNTLPFGTPMNGGPGPMPGSPMPGGPLPPSPGMMSPMSGAPSYTQGENLLASAGNLLRLSIDALSAALAGGTRMMQNYAGGQQGNYGHEYYYAPQGYQHGHGHHHPHGHCCGSHDPACHYPSCCDCYGETCCNPSVNGCC